MSVVGAPISWGQPHAGTDLGPTLMRKSGLLTCLEALEWTVDEKGDIQFDEPTSADPKPDEALIGGKAKNCFCLGKALEKVYRVTRKSLEEGHFALTLGGDHSIGLATVAAVLKVRPESGILWVDAHGDLNIPSTSPSGNMHGMPLGILMKLIDNKLLPGFEWLDEVPILKPEHLVFIGLRDLDKGERVLIREKGIKAYTMHHVDHFGIGKVMDLAVEHFTLSDGSMRPLHLSYDIDAVDPAEAPATGTVVRGGFNFREAHYIAEAASSTKALQSMDLVEVNPTLMPGKEAELTSHLGMALIASAMGSRIL